MKLSVRTKYNGKYYDAGSEIPCDAKASDVKVEAPQVEEEKVEKPKAVKTKK